ncbi:hypothetical protein Glove_551g22 [Diversispora epigaea]|uniref:Protein kinase domain-containing protein n=1 Tax=Diversispora epigaea TaxID=1348612 RepID=A0A397GGA2_9GLOM|nr:hypothetical protein Glove_551g22 [Diversispora epigaea]
MPCICPECNQLNKYGWCKPCNSTHFKNDFDKCSKWVNGRTIDWDFENQQWKRYGQVEVALKKFNGIVNINEDFLNEMAIHLKTSYAESLPVQITKDPETHEYMMVLNYFQVGSLRNYLNNNFNNINWYHKLYYLKDLANDFANIHKLDIVHHPGNILKENIKNSQKNSISGVLPYIAPEVLTGEEYTKAADVYSFAFVAYEIITGIPLYHDVSHDKDLAFKICNGFRPKIPFYTPKLITQIIMRCWDTRTTFRPTFEKLFKESNKCWNDYRENDRNNNNEITIQIEEAEEFSKRQTTTTTLMNYKTHPQAIYTSRLLNFLNLPKPKNEENFEKKLEELTKSFYRINSTFQWSLKSPVKISLSHIHFSLFPTGNLDCVTEQVRDTYCTKYESRIIVKSTIEIFERHNSEFPTPEFNRNASKRTSTGKGKKSLGDSSKELIEIGPMEMLHTSWHCNEFADLSKPFKDNIKLSRR